MVKKLLGRHHCLIAIGLWGYLEVTSPTALIPVGFGAALILCSSGVRKENKVVAHIAVLLTLLILIAGRNEIT